MADCLIVGGGVIGLSLAYELAGRGLSVQVLEAGQPAREASWAGAGILPPASGEAADPLERLVALSNRLHAQWSDQLRSETGIDNGYRRCGAIYVARGPAEVAQLEHLAEWAAVRGIAAEPLSAKELTRFEPALEPADLRTALCLPEECQIRNPRHLKALLSGCLQRGVTITAGASVNDFVIRGQRVRGAQTNGGLLESDLFCLAAGAWSGPLARRLGLDLGIKPIRGQMLLLNTARPVLARIVNDGPRYLVPRTDGRLLVGSTEEDVGFDKQTTAGVTADLLGFALALAPRLASATIERSWAGLRPSSADGLPYLGMVSALENLVVAAGHFRGGLQMSTGTAQVLADQLLGQIPSVDLESFRPDRPTVSTPRVSWPELAPSAKALRS